MKKIFLSVLIGASLFVSVSAGRFDFNPWTVYAFNQVGTTGGVTTTSTSSKCITAKLYSRGSEKDRVKMWVVDFYSERAKCDAVSVTEGGSELTAKNYDGEYSSGNDVMVRWRNDNGDWNSDYTIAGYAIYY